MHKCNVAPASIGQVSLTVCADCAHYEWTDAAGLPVEPAEGIASAFGPFPLIERLTAIGAPGGLALIYRVPPRYRSRLSVLPIGTWTQIHPALFASQDGMNLMLAPTDPAVSRAIAAAG